MQNVDVPEDGCEEFSLGTQGDPVTSCQALLNAAPNAPSGNYWIDPEDDGGAFQVFCDMDGHGGGWTRIVKSSGTVNYFSASYTNGLGNINDDDYIVQCSKLTALGNSVTVRVNMGEVRDFYRIHGGVDLCQMLSESPGTHHLWSNQPDSNYVQPEYYGGHLGGSKSGWPTLDNRQYISFWGGNSSHPGGCCSLDLGTYNGSWGRAFEMYLR